MSPIPAFAGAPAWYPYPPAPAQRTSGAAVTSLVFGILSFVLWFLGIIAAPIAIATGFAARRRIDAEPDRVKGTGQATAGLVLGFTWMILATAIESAIVYSRLR